MCNIYCSEKHLFGSSGHLANTQRGRTNKNTMARSTKSRLESQNPIQILPQTSTTNWCHQFANLWRICEDRWKNCAFYSFHQALSFNSVTPLYKASYDASQMLCSKTDIWTKVWLIRKIRLQILILKSSWHNSTLVGNSNEPPRKNVESLSEKDT